jgi:hypothetical protein
MIKRNKFIALVMFDAPKGATRAEIREFFLELQSAGGCQSPDHPLFESFDNVKIEKLIKINQERS